MRSVAPPRPLAAAFATVALLHIALAAPSWALEAQPQAVAAPSAALPAGAEVVVFQGGLQGGWQDWGWAHRTIVAGQPARLCFNNYAGWRLAKRGLTGSYIALRFRLQAPAKHGAFLEVRLGGQGASADAFPKVPIEPTAGGNIWQDHSIPLSALNPSQLPFDQILFRAKTAVDAQEVAIDSVVLVAGVPPPAVGRSPLPTKRERLVISCVAPSHAISPQIYGIAYSPRLAGKEAGPFLVGATSRRWGGNPASRYNHRLGNAWNTASDWFFQNVNYTKWDNYSWRDFLLENAAHNMTSAITVPMIGWVAKDTEAHSFSVAAMGPQKYAQGDAGNGVDQAGKPLKSPDPRTTSIEASPAFVAEWAAALEKVPPTAAGPAVVQYILDNEPALWNSTHRDVHPEPLTYDELLSRSIAYGEAIRQVAPKADIAGPAEWGWPAYFFSAKDAAAGFRQKPDRRAHGDVPLLAWYLSQLKVRAAKSGRHVLDTVDLHFYPQISGVYGHGEQVGPDGAARRLRATRSLWDPTYKDESWIADNIELLPRMKRLIAENYPGRGISIGEYNFGGERHISGGLAQAEALGRFGQAGIRSAYLWTYPPQASFAAEAFLAYRNYDGQGAAFLDQSLETNMAEQVSLYAAKGKANDKLTAVALNLRAEQDVEAEITLQGCGAYSHVRAFAFDVDTPHLQQVSASRTPQVDRQNRYVTKLPAYSLLVMELTR